MMMRTNIDKLRYQSFACRSSKMAFGIKTIVKRIDDSFTECYFRVNTYLYLKIEE